MKGLIEYSINENLEIKKYNNSIKKLLEDIKRTKKHSTRIIKDYSHFLQAKGSRNSNINMINHFSLGSSLKNKFQRRKSLGNFSSNHQVGSISIFEKLFKDILKNKNNEKEQSFSHLESIYNDIIKIKDKFLSYKIDKKLNLNNLNYINLRKRNKILIEKEKNENKKVENLDFEFLWRFHDHTNFK